MEIETVLKVLANLLRDLAARIDAGNSNLTEEEALTDEQKMKLAQDEDYAQNDIALQQMVQTEILNLVKGKIENSQSGKELLTNQLSIVKKLKKKIVEETNQEMEAFRRFKEYSKSHPNVTYEEFIKTVYQ